MLVSDNSDFVDCAFILSTSCTCCHWTRVWIVIGELTSVVKLATTAIYNGGAVGLLVAIAVKVDGFLDTVTVVVAVLLPRKSPKWKNLGSVSVIVLVLLSSKVMMRV